MTRALGLLLAVALAVPTAACGGGYSRLPEAAPSPAGAVKLAATQQRKLRRNASLEMEVGDEDAIPTTLKRIEALAKENGGYTAGSTHRSITIKVPTERTEAVMDTIAGLGEITKRRLSVQDVTARFVDMELRIKNLRALRDRMQALLDKAEQVKDLLAIEKELGRITGELEAMEGQLRLLQSQTALGTIRVRVTERVSPGPLGWIPYGLYLGVKWLLIWD